jgi:phosphate-selective porin OprO and OprP
MNGGLNKINRYLLAGAGAIGILAAGATGAGAQDMREIQAQIDAMQATIKALQKQVQDAQAQASAAKTAAAEAKKDDLDLKVKWKGAPEFSSGDGKFKFKVRGRLQVDYNGIDQDHAIDSSSNNPSADVSAVEIRRARLGVEGVVFYDVKYKLEVDFASGTDVNSGVFKDAYVAYAGLKPKDWGIGEIRIGNQYVYNSLEQITSSRFTTFMERAAFTEAFFLDRQIGAAILAGGEHWSLQTGIYGAPPEEQVYFLQDQFVYSGRFTLAPINRNVNGVQQVLHLGVSGRHRDSPEDCRRPRDSDQITNSDCTSSANAGWFRYRARAADLHLADRFVATPRIGDADTLLNFEGAFVWGPFSMQGEWAQLWVDTGDTPASLNNVDPTYNGWYVDASYFLTGETRTYEAATGEFGRPKVKNPILWGQNKGGWGAWQIAGRYDVINLSDKSSQIAGCLYCGDQETWLFAVNWWLNDYTRLALNVTQSKIEGSNPLNASSTPARANQNTGAEISGVGLRAQVDW